MFELESSRARRKSLQWKRRLIVWGHLCFQLLPIIIASILVVFYFGLESYRKKVTSTLWYMVRGLFGFLPASWDASIFLHWVAGLDWGLGGFEVVLVILVLLALVSLAAGALFQGLRTFFSRRRFGFEHARAESPAPAAPAESALAAATVTSPVTVDEEELAPSKPAALVEVLGAKSLQRRRRRLKGLFDIPPMGFPGVRTSVGISFGTECLRAVKVQRVGRSITIMDAGKAPLPAGALQAGSSVPPAKIANALKNLHARFGVKKGRLVVGMETWRDMDMRYVRLPWMPPLEMEEAALLEAKEIFSLPRHDLAVDWFHLGEDEAPDRAAQQDILLVATPRKALDWIQESFWGIEAVLDAVDLDSLANRRVLMQVGLLARERGSLNVVLDIDGGLTRIFFFDGTFPILAEAEPVGLEDMVAAVEEGIGKERTHVNRALKAFGVESDTPITGYVLPVARRIGETVADCLKPFVTAHAGLKLASLTLLGEGAGLKGLGRLLGGMLAGAAGRHVAPRGLRVKTLNPFLGIPRTIWKVRDSVNTDAGPEYVTALGLALWDPKTKARVSAASSEG